MDRNKWRRLKKRADVGVGRGFPACERTSTSAPGDDVVQQQRGTKSSADRRR